MTDYELAYLMGETAMHIQDLYMNLFSIVSAYLLVGYLLAHRLTRTMTVIINTLFILTTLSSIILLERHGAVFVSLMEQIHLRGTNGGGLEWFASSRTPLWMVRTMPAANVIFPTIVAAGALYFFFHSRKANFSGADNLADRLLGKD